MCETIFYAMFSLFFFFLMCPEKRYKITITIDVPKELIVSVVVAFIAYYLPYADISATDFFELVRSFEYSKLLYIP